MAQCASPAALADDSGESIQHVEGSLCSPPRRRPATASASLTRPTFSSAVRVSQVLRQPAPSPSRRCSQASSTAPHEASEHGCATPERVREFFRRNEDFLHDREEFLNALRRLKEKEELEACTFEPNVPPPGTLGAQGQRRRARARSAGHFYERAKKQELRKEEYLRKLREEKLRSELQECSFHPATSFRPPRRPVATCGATQHPPAGRAGYASLHQGSLLGRANPTGGPAHGNSKVAAVFNSEVAAHTQSDWGGALAALVTEGRSPVLEVHGKLGPKEASRSP